MKHLAIVWRALADAWFCVLVITCIAAVAGDVAYAGPLLVGGFDAEPVVDLPGHPGDFWCPDDTIRLDVDVGTSTVGNGVLCRVNQGEIHPNGGVRTPASGFLRFYYQHCGGSCHEAGTGIRSAVSFDQGITWEKEEDFRLEGLHGVASLVEHNGGLRMYVEQYPGAIRIVSATTVNGLDWDPDPGVRIAPGGYPGGWDEGGAANPTVLRVAPDTLRMFYTGRTNTRRMLSAWSSDGLIWNSDGGIRIDVGTRSPGDSAAPYDSIINEARVHRLPDSTLIMYYTGGTGTSENPIGRTDAILTAVSGDGLIWVKEPGIRLLRGARGGLDSGGVAGPNVFSPAPDQFRMIHVATDSIGTARGLSATSVRTSVASLDSTEALGMVSLLGVAPSPTRAGTVITFVVKAESDVRASIVDVRGRLVEVLAERRFAAGPSVLRWEGTDATGRAVPAGIYFAVVTINGDRHARKILITR